MNGKLLPIDNTVDVKNATYTNYRHKPRDFNRTVFRTFVSDELYGPILNEARITVLATEKSQPKTFQLTPQKKVRKILDTTMIYQGSR